MLFTVILPTPTTETSLAVAHQAAKVHYWPSEAPL